MGAGLLRTGAIAGDVRAPARQPATRCLWLALALAAGGCARDPQQGAAADVDWPAYGGDAAQSRYSQLDQINTRMLSLGVLLLSVSLGVGASWWLRNTDTVDQAKLLVTVGVWFAYLVVLLLRWRSRLVSVRFSWVCLVMFMLALISLGPVNSSRHHKVILTPEAR